ncbi:MAG TPA: DUF6069 family protein [Acidimicrobiales bacterium]
MMTAPHEDDTTRTPAAGATTPRTAMLGGSVGAGLALVANLAVFAAGNLGAPIRVVTGSAPDGTDLALGEVVGTTLVTVAAGAALLAVLARRADRFRLWTAVAVAVAVLSAVPLWRLDVDAGSKVALTTMHLLTGAAAVAGQVAARRRAGTAGDRSRLGAASPATATTAATR